MSINEQVVEILETVKPTKNLAKVTDIIEGGYIDSFELMYLISLLSDKFGVEISVDDISVENFNSASSIADMIGRLKKR